MPHRIESYEAAIEFLYGRINYERVDVQAYSTSDFKLDRMRMLLSLLGNPQEQIPAVHVAGTKGKGSTCSMIATVLAAAGLRAGLYISPHISAFEERMGGRHAATEHRGDEPGRIESRRGVRADGIWPDRSQLGAALPLRRNVRPEMARRPISLPPARL